MDTVDSQTPEGSDTPEIAGAKRYAEIVGIDLAERVEPMFPNLESLNATLALLKQEFPERQSAYVPSGTMPIGALMLMIVGSVIAIPTGALAASAILALGLILTVVIGVLILAFAILIVLLFPLIALLIGIATFVLQFWAAGFAPALIICGWGQRGKNRNTVAPALVSIACSAMSVYIFMYLATYVLAGMEPETWFNGDFKFLESFYSEFYFWMVTGIGMMIAAISAWFSAVSSVYDAKFCEECDQHMEQTDLPSVSIGGLKALIELVDEGNLLVATGIYQAAAGDEGKSRLFCCPDCLAGFLDLEFALEAKYQIKEDDEDERSESWIVGSTALTSEDTPQLRHLAGSPNADSDE